MAAAVAPFEPAVSTDPQQRLAGLVLDRAPTAGTHDTAIPGLSVIRADAPTSFESSVWQPALGFVVQGTKSVRFGDREIVYRPLTYLVSNIHLPVLGQVIEASPERPYLGVKLDLNPKEIADLILKSGNQLMAPAQDTTCPHGTCGLGTAQMDDVMHMALTRLLSLLDTPSDIRVLAPLARLELLYRALTGELGPRIRKFAATDSQAHRISRVIATLKDRFAQPLRVAELAADANMSESSLFHNFKQVTRMSPLQFQKKLRLHEARRLMLAQGLDAAAASYRVGYESPSQFSREYSRLFGAPPRTDIARLRATGAMPA